MSEQPNVPIVDRDAIDHPDLLAAMAHTDRVRTPPTLKLQAMAHAPEIAAGFARYWRTVAEGGRVGGRIKELGRLTIAQLLGCAVCSSSRSAVVTDLDEDDVAACALPDLDHPDPRTRAAVRFARTLVLDDGHDAARYAELAEVFDWDEIIELVSFLCLVLGDVRMVKSFGLEGLLGLSESDAPPTERE